MLRTAKYDDAPIIAQLHATSWRTAYAHILSADYLSGPIEEERRRVWQERMAVFNPQMHVTLAEESGNPLGFVCTFASDDERWGALIDNLHVVPGSKRKGIGARLLQSAAKWISDQYPEQALYLWVFEANEPAQRFYERMGGQVVERLVKPNPGGGEAANLRYCWPEPAHLVTDIGCRSN